MTWTYNNESVSDEVIGDAYGFVYIIENLIDGRRYIGRKYLTKAAYKTVKGKRKKIRKASTCKISKKNIKRPGIT